MGNLNRKLRRQNTKGTRTATDDHRKLPVQFTEQMDELGTLGGFANHVSMAQTGLPTTESGRLASMVFAKCCAHTRSIGAIALQSSMFDHHAIMALARMIVEASTMVAYLLDPVSSAEWELRSVVLRLHDTVTRIKLLRGFGLPGDDLRAGRTELQAELEANEAFQKLPEDRRKRLVQGEDMYARGMRSVATKIMGWDEEQFTGIYAYLSSHTHSAPMSFFRMEDHRIDYFHPSETQTEILALSMLTATVCLRRVMLRMIDQYPEQISEYHEELVAEARAEDAQCPMFKVTKQDLPAS